MNVVEVRQKITEDRGSQLTKDDEDDELVDEVDFLRTRHEEAEEEDKSYVEKEEDLGDFMVQDDEAYSHPVLPSITIPAREQLRNKSNRKKKMLCIK